MQEVEDERASKKARREKDHEICETNGAKIRDAATKCLKDKMKPKNANTDAISNYSFDSDDESSNQALTPSSTSSHSRSGNNQSVIANTLESMAAMLKQANESEATAAMLIAAAASEERKLKAKELELHELKQTRELRELELKEKNQAKQWELEERRMKLQEQPFGMIMQMLVGKKSNE
ncbi:UNVERIFIED_CONTAM: hypothetical protein HDU68_005685 [Siphonaria sp. JEL0065]|nr:hypothetical protein HDU68_005685 [Siphonaria sp. JEL0065]